MTMLMRRMVLSGLAVMAVVALCSAIWPAVAAVVAAMLVSLVVVSVAVPVLLGVRWARAELAWRGELATMPAVDAAAYGASSVAPSLAELRESA